MRPPSFAGTLLVGWRLFIGPMWKVARLHCVVEAAGENPPRSASGTHTHTHSHTLTHTHLRIPALLPSFYRVSQSRWERFFSSSGQSCRILLGFYRVSMTDTRIYWILPDPSGFYWDLTSFTGFLRAGGIFFSDSGKSYRVLLGFTEFQ